MMLYFLNPNLNLEMANIGRSDENTIKERMTLDDLKDINDGYTEFHSKFIIDNVINNVIRIKE